MTIRNPATSTPRVSIWEWAQTALLAANLAWTTLGRGGFPPQIAVVTATLTAALLVVHLLARVVQNKNDGAHAVTHPAGWFFLPFLLYALVNVLWVSPVPWLAWRDWFGWAQMIAVFWVVLNGIRSPAPQRVLFLTIIGLGLVGVLLACYQCFVNADWQMLGGARPYYRGRGSGSFGMPNSLAAFFLLILPAAAALGFRRGATPAARIWWGWVTLVLAFGLGLTISRGAWLAFALALMAWPLCASRGPWLRRIGIAALVVGGLLLVGGVLYSRSAEVRVRLASLMADAGERTRPIVWRGAWALFREHPVTGTGAGSYDVLFEKYRPEGFRDRALYAHNDYLNTLSDYGLAGFGLFFGAIALVAARCASAPRDDSARRTGWLDSPAVVGALGVGLLAFALQLAVEFHLKIPALALAVAIVAALVVNRRWPAAAPASASRHSRVAAGIVAAGCAAAFLLFFLPKFRAESFRQSARAAIDALARGPADAAHYRAPLELARTALVRATTLDPANGQAWADLAYATALWSRIETGRNSDLGKNAQLAAEQALGCSRLSAEFWIRRGVARDLQSRWSEAGEDFATAVRLAPNNASVWYYYAEHLSGVPSVRESAQAAVALCLRLDPGNLPGQALRERLAIKQKSP